MSKASNSRHTATAAVLLGCAAISPLQAEQNPPQTGVAPAAEATETPEEHAARVNWWRDAKFGLFLHWGPASIAGTELSWSRPAPKPLDIHNDPAGTVSAPEYDNLYKQFDPQKFDAKQWVKIAQDAGMRYMVLTTKHHDGFSLFATRLSDYNITQTPFKRDIVKELADACHAAGMRFGVYYSQRDWYHPDYGIGDNRKYLDFMNGQLRELLSNYGKVDILWFDSYGTGDLEKFWRIGETWKLIKKLQPEALVNNRLAVLAGYNRQPEPYRGDFDTPEQRLGTFQLGRDWESCITLVGHQWSYKPGGEMMSFEKVVNALVSTATGGGNLLLNVGPMPTGEIEPRQVALLKQVGDWAKKHRVALYGTRGGPYVNGRWGGATHKGNTLYLFCRTWAQDRVALNALPAKVLGAQLLASGETVAFEQTDKGLTITVPAEKRDALFTVVALTLDQPLPDGLALGGIHSRFEDEVTYGTILSAEATFSTSSVSPEDDKAADHPRLFSGPLASSGFAFSTDAETNPWMKIDLGAIKNVTGVRVTNGPSFRQKADLFISVSADGQEWKQVWKAGDWDAVWDIPVTQIRAGAEVPGLPVRYIRFAFKPDPKWPFKKAPKTAIKLQRVEVYGK